jgi:hypothetical protein
MMPLWHVAVAGALWAQVLSPPAMGGAPSAFDATLGAPNDGTLGSQFHYLRCAGTDIDQFVVLAPNDQVWTIQREYCQLAGPPAEQRLAEAAQYLPADAVLGDGLTTGEGAPAQTYVSQTVASALPSVLFHDCAGEPVTPGTVIVVADVDGGWFVGPGTCA